MTSPYTTSFYNGQADGSRRSADVIVPIVLGLSDVRSVVDFGCGVGTWLEAFGKAGIEDCLGIDGDYVDLSQLRIPRANFRACDLTSAIQVERRFDLACALEVAEHLPETAADRFVATLVNAAPRVLFSAAIPGQGGTSHVNEQWQSYWAQRFAAYGYSAFDCIRQHVYGHPDVEWWYQQNALMFCSSDAWPRNCVPVSDAYAIDRAHPQVVRKLDSGPHSGREAVTAIGRGLRILGRKSTERLGLRARREASASS